MSDELRQLLRDAAPAPARAMWLADLERESTARRRNRRIGLAAAVTVSAATAGLVIGHAAAGDKAGAATITPASGSSTPATPPPSHAGPVLRINANGQLSDGLWLGLTGSGFPPHASVVGRQCPANVDCASIPSTFHTVTDGSGHLSVVSWQMHTLVKSSSGAELSCAHDCTVMVTTEGTDRVSATSGPFDVPAHQPKPSPGRLAGEPSWLPPGARFVARQPWGVNGTQLVYRLSGAANQWDVGGGDKLMVFLTPGPAKNPEPALGDAHGKNGIVTLTISVSGHPALYQHGANGLGTYRVDWIADGVYYSVVMDRLKLAEGVSGVPPARFLRFAKSITP